MADVKTILRELSTIVGIGMAQNNIEANNIGCELFCQFVEEYTANIGDYSSEF